MISLERIIQKNLKYFLKNTFYIYSLRFKLLTIIERKVHDYFDGMRHQFEDSFSYSIVTIIYLLALTDKFMATADKIDIQKIYPQNTQQIQKKQNWRHKNCWQLFDSPA